MDFISSVLGILLSMFYEIFLGKNLLESRIKPKSHKLYWYILVLFRKNFKSYVSEIGLDPWTYPNVDDLKNARLTNKKDLDKYFSSSNTSFLLNLFSFKMSSSGSTGKPFQFRIFILQWIEEQARMYASFRLGGYVLGKKFVIFRSYSPKKNERNIKEVKWKNWTYFNSFSIDDKSLMEYYNYLIKYKVKFMRTYPSTLATFLKFLKSNNLELNLKMIHVSSENISDKLIADSEEYFKCKLINYYGQVEQALLGINLSESLSISILPYTNWYKLDNGTIASLNLINWTHPLINYQVNDHLVKLKENQFKIIGRNNVYLKNSSGNLISTINFYTFMQKFDNLVKWQIVQNKDLDIRLNYEGQLSATEKNYLKSGIKERLGEIKVTFNTENFEYNGEGKINPIYVT